MEKDKKTERKRRKFAARLKSSKAIICTDVQQTNIILCNVGQATSLSKKTICRLISELPVNVEAPKLVLEKGETYSFLVFRKIKDSTLFLETHNGRGADDNGTTIYMNFVENVPSNEVLCEHMDPSGLTIIEDFITEDDEKTFIKLFDWYSDEAQSNLKNRRVKHYGYEFRYGSNDVDVNAPLIEKIPEECNILWERLNVRGFNLTIPDQLTVNIYEPGQGIPSHVDRHSPFGDTILSLSLASSVVMDWKHYTGKYVPISVPARSLLIMQGEARYDWQHGIQSRTWDPIIEHRTNLDNSHKQVKVITNDTELRQKRISMTFRWTRNSPCECDFKTLCDSVKKSTSDIEDKVAADLEELHVHKVYDQIAGHFSATRHKPWPRVVQFMERVPTGAVVLDLGCGNGKNILQRNDILQLGCERSMGLLEECRTATQRAGPVDCVRLDLLRAPLADCCADAIICIAVLHHLSTKVRRIEAISTIARLLRTGGRALITVWSKDQSKSNYLCKNKNQNNQLEKEVHTTVGGINLPVHENRTQFEYNDLLVPWKLRTVKEKKLSNQPESTLLRYYHVFEEGELVALCEEVVGLVVEDSFYEEGNWCVICRKC